MPGEIAEAFVLVRPITTGFKSQVEGESKSAALGAAKVFAGAFAAVKLFDFAKDAVKEAAQVQKSTEGIRDGFGGASDSVLEFSHTAAQQFGISTADSQKFAASLAITAKNLGISQDQAAEMAIGLQKVAGSVGNIKGQDPAQFFDKLQLALLGNTRGLKSLGIAADTTRIQQAALDAGIVKATVNQAEVTKQTEKYRSAVAEAQDAVAKYGKGSDEAASAQNKVALAQQAVQKAVAGTVPKLDAAQKAQAIYALATTDLDKKQQQAAKHSGDLANEQQKLSAEWANAKEQVGAALVPAITSLAGELLSLFDVIRANEGGIKEVFGTAAEIISPVTFAIKELHEQSQVTVPVIAALTGAFVTYKTVAFAAKEATLLYEFALSKYQATARAAGSALATLTGETQASAAGQVAAAGEVAEADAISAETITAAEIAKREAYVTTLSVAVATGAGIAEAQEAAALASEAAAAQVIAADAEAVAATEALDVALASNPFGLLALGVSAVVGGLIGYKVLAGESADSTDDLTQSLQDARTASDELTDALSKERNGHLDLLQANIDHRRAAEDLTDAQKAAAAAIEKYGKGSKQAKDATDKAVEAQIRYARTGQEIVRANQEIADGAAGHVAAIKKFQGSIDDLRDSITKQGAADRQATILRDRGSDATTRAKDLAEVAAETADKFARSTKKLADQTSDYADKLRKQGNPQAAAFQDKLAAQALAAEELTVQIGKVPTKKQIDVFYKNNMAGLIQEAKNLHSEIAGIPSLKTVTIQFAQGHGVPVTRAGGGPIEAGQLAVTSERGAELSVSSVGRQVISHSESVGLLANLADAINRLSQKLDGGTTQAPATQTGPIVETVNITEAGDARRTAQKVVDALALAVPR